MAESLILSDGTRTYDFLATSAAIYVAPDGIGLPVVSKDNTYAEGSDSEGRTRIRSRAQNSEAGSLTLQFRASTAATFWDAIDNLQELVESAHLNKGTLAYTKYGSTSSVTYDLESIQVTGLPIKGVHSAQRHAEATITFESKPYGRLPTQRLNVQDSYQTMVTALSPSIFLPLGASSGLTDLSGNARNGTAAGGVTVGGATGPLTVSDGGATDFDGTDDRITTTYATRRNLCTNPNFETNITGIINGASATAQSSTQAYDGTYSCRVTSTGAGAAPNANATQANVGVAGVQYTFSFYLYHTVASRQGRADIRFYDSGGTIIGSATTGTAGTATQNTWTRFSVTATAPALTAYIGYICRCDVTSAGAASEVSYIDGLLIEAASSAGTYFPTTAQLASGEAGWTGTANASASDIGCFANGTSRSFMGWAYRDTSSGVDTIFSGSGATPPVLAFSSGSQNIVWKPDNSTTTTWASGISNGTWFHWELEFAEPTASNNASLYINGALISAQTNAGQYSANCGNFQLGALTSTTDPFDGRQAWVSVHQTALTATQIRDAYDAGKAQITLDGPIDFFTVSGVTGQVPSLPVLTLDDVSAQSRNIVEVGVQNKFNPASPEALLLNLELGLTAQAGSSTTRAGSVSTNICRAALATTPISICKAASQTHKGLWKVRVRVYPSATTVRLRLAWRSGDGPFAREKWVSVPNSAGWYDLDLGTVNIKELPSGHTCEFRVEGKSTSGSPTVDIDVVECLPADSYTKLRGSSSPEVGTGAIVAMDDFSTQTSGAVTGKTPLLAPAGNYSGAGDTTDFEVDTANQSIYRSAVSDSALNNGRYLRCGSGTLALTIASVDVSLDNSGPPGSLTSGRFGLFIRYVDTSNWLAAVITSEVGFSLIKRVAGTETVLGDYTEVSGSLPFSGACTVTISADASGNVIAYAAQRFGAGSKAFLVTGDSSIATAGALASGGYGIFDATTGASADTRYYDNFTVSTLATSATIINPAINSGYGLDLKHNTALTDNSTGTSTGTTPIRQGNYPKLPPATRNGTKSRVVVRARRDDNDLGLADSGTSDVLTAGLTVTPRVHLTGT